MIAAGFTCFVLSSCKGKSEYGTIIITRTREGTKDLNYSINDSSHYIFKSEIVSLTPGKTGEPLKILTGDYFSARSPEISFDGKHMLFTAQKTQNDPWQIWEMDLSSLLATQVTSSKENCTDPAYLPGKGFVFSQYAANDTLKGAHSLFVSDPDGSNLKRITFNPNTYFASRILNDGRVLTVGKQVFPDQGKPVYMILRPDGTKCQLFYKGEAGNTVCGPGREVNGRIIFTESDNEKQDVVSISYSRPLHSRVNLTSGIEGDFLYVNLLNSGKLIVSYRNPESGRYALYEFDPDTRKLGSILYKDNDFDVLEAVTVEEHQRPKKLPSEVNMGVRTGLMLCDNINVLNPAEISSLPEYHASRIEVTGIDSTLGILDVAEDGSFYLKVVADKPFRIRTIDKDGQIIHSSSAWMWLRPNERRGCVGCHEDPELTPGNRIPLSVKKSPVIIPMHIKKVVEKKASLE